MQILVILGHPNPESFNHAIAKTVVNTLISEDFHVILHDLYAESFPPLITKEEFIKDAPLDNIITKHCLDISLADGIVVIHPNWWGQPPAIIKGWIDRVLRPGVAYQFKEGDLGDGEPIGLLKAQKAVILNTSDTPDEREIKVFGNPLSLLWKNNLGFCGIKTVYQKTFGVIVTSSLDKRREWLEEVKTIIRENFSKGFIQ